MIQLEVVGIPAPQGSKRGFSVGGKVVLVEGGSKVGREKLGSWRGDVIDAARKWITDHPSYETTTHPLSIEITFWMPRPKSAPKSRVWPSVKPDSFKLVRATEDALKLAGLYADDALICRHIVWKRYAVDRPTGATIRVERLA